MRRIVLLLALLACVFLSIRPLFAQVDLEAMAQRAAVRHANVPRKVLAFYYPWYVYSIGPDGRRRSSWEGVDPVKHAIANVAHWPQLGPYDSEDPKLINQHCTWARQSGVDVLISSWWGKGSPTDRLLEPILDACHDAGLEATVYYETVRGTKNAAAAAKEIVELLGRYAKHPAWLRVDGKPVVFVYGRVVGELGLTGCLQAAARTHRDFPGGAVWLGDDLSRSSARIFDGIHTYNPVGSLQGKTPDEVRQWAKTAYPEWVATADAFGRISAITVVPGYDDTKIRKPGLRVDRANTSLYRAQWEEAIAADPHWVLITSWNEWYEGSEIEPSGESGMQYLRLTADYAARFKQLGPRADRAPPEAGNAAISPGQTEKLKRLRCGLLPGAESPAIWSMARLPQRPVSLEWSQVAAMKAEDARRLPVLVYAAHEQYRQTVDRAGDVDEGLLRYLSGGGMLVVLPAGPMPFYLNEKREAVNSAAKLGIPLSVNGADGGWERPPAGVALSLVQVGRQEKGDSPHLPERPGGCFAQMGTVPFFLPSLPASFPFPSQGDLRWRPLVRSQLPQGDLVVPLVELRDVSGKHYGDAVAYVEHRASEPKNGKILYVWFGLLNTPYGERLVEDLLALAAEFATRSPAK